MKIEICQTNIIWENKETNLKKAEHIIKNSTSNLILFPEMSFTGFSMNTDLTGEKDSYTLNTLKKMAQKYNKSLSFGWVKKTSKKSENHYTFVNNNGEVLSDYIKIHPFSYSGEDNHFKSGKNINIFEYMGFNICNFICYDLRFPEIFQIASKKADIITVAANWPNSRADHWKTLLKARAIENMCYIIGINCVGNIGNIYYSGDSCIINPNGNIIETLSNEEGNITVEIENNVNEYRKNFPTKNDRRETFYKNFY